MPILVRNLRLGLDEPEAALVGQVGQRLGIPESAVRAYSVVSRSVDARRQDVCFVYHVEVALDEPPAREKARIKSVPGGGAVWIEPRVDSAPRAGQEPLPEQPVIIGFGPGGMFAALRLAQLGYRPIVFERGRAVKQRHRDIMQRYYVERDFDPTSNLLFGEGGAGTYSDGKLYTRVNDPLCRYVLEALYHHGGDPDILINTRPHIGSDRLPTICARIRERIEACGGEIHFETTLTDLKHADGRLEAVCVSGPNRPAGGEWIKVGPTILAIGHSARDTLRLLFERGVHIDPKPFQIGVRVEHPQAMIDARQYGQAAGHARLAPAEYHLVAKGAAEERGDVFSFCMCPGGTILPTNESAGLIATNGASRANRASPFANSGLVITVDPTELGLDAMGGLAYQEKWERMAFAATKESYRVPAQRVDDFLSRRMSSGTLETSFPLGGQWADMRAILPEQVSNALDKAFPILDRKFPGYSGHEGLITGPETRPSAPIRVLREPETRQAEGIDGLYPVGEGAGYAGGIISAAVDGIKSADRIVEHYAPPT